MELPGLTISIIKLLFFGGLLWAFFKLVHRGIDLLLSGQVYHKRLEEALLIVRAASWIIFIFWAVDVIFQGQLLIARLFSGMLILLVVGISWSLIRDIISGFLIRMEGTYHNNSHVRIHDVEGTVRKLGFRSMEIETDRGETIRIPYKIVDDEVIPDDSEISNDTKLALKTLLWDKMANSGMADTKEFQNAVSDWAQLLNQPIPKIRRLSLDIEVESEIGRIPDPNLAEKKVTAIGFEGSDGLKKIFVLRRDGIKDGTNYLDTKI
jgi:hypothetical protein